jgi:hypothetical protein
MPRAETYARFQIGDVCLYQGKRYTIVSHVWVTPFPGYVTWRIERLLDSSESPERLTVEFRSEEMAALDGLTTKRNDCFYHEVVVSEGEIENEDDDPTWQDIDNLRARHVQLEMQIEQLQSQLKTKFRRTGIKRRITD